MASVQHRNLKKRKIFLNWYDQERLHEDVGTNGCINCTGVYNTLCNIVFILNRNTFQTLYNIVS